MRVCRLEAYLGKDSIMTLQSSFGCLRTAANFLHTMDRTYSKRLSYGDGQAFAKTLMSTLVGKLNMFAFLKAPACRELWPSTSIKACKKVCLSWNNMLQHEQTWYGEYFVVPSPKC